MPASALQVRSYATLKKAKFRKKRLLPSRKICPKTKLIKRVPLQRKQRSLSKRSKVLKLRLQQSSVLDLSIRPSLMSSSLVRQRLAVLSTKKVRYGSSTFGPPGADHANNQWLTTKKCLRKKVKSGETKSESSEFQVTKVRRKSRNELKTKNGTRSSTTTKLLPNAVRSTVFKAFHTSC